MKLIVPSDGWGKDSDGFEIIPRRWQTEVIPIVLKHYSSNSPSRGVVHAITGAGKSSVIAQICACIHPENNDAIVVSTSRQKLVRQILQTIKDRLETDDFMSEPVVGAYYAEAHDIHNRRIVCCNDSLGSLADALAKIGRHASWWCADELHRSESPSMKNAYNLLMPKYSIGFSATPYRANPKHGISNFDTVIYKYSIQNALDDGNVIVPWRIVGWEGEDTDLDSACLEMLKSCEGGRAIVNAVSISDANLFAQKATATGYAMKSVHSKQSHVENEEILEELKNGKIQAVAYADLLCEGVDLPFLKTMCLRRPVSSRNRFVQELGRGIRYYKDRVTGEEKKELVLLDPHDLMSVHKLSHAAVLSGDYDPDDPDLDNEPEGKKLERSLQQECFAVLRHLTEVKAGKAPLSTSPLQSYLATLVSIFDTFGLLEKKISSRDWRREPASQKQISAMEKLKWAFSRKQVPVIHRNALEILSGVGSRMNRGLASDLISLEMSLAEKSTWPKFSQLDQIVADGLARHEKKKAGGAVLRPPQPKGEVNNPTALASPAIVQGLLFGDLGATKK